eukprot:gnl/Hemi2/9123_TR3166_c0_g1_i1.p1 gnl/Hemi2/9123_TR3166_c0_g1~~gnl/Hemi2/9123_TR3166_c0_g1_i1.p1  ORF type:complete len:659 (-),score=334.21 gnl/Hemi2/9123_TR3166_c0_g1_i1:220-2196(-)
MSSRPKRATTKKKEEEAAAAAAAAEVAAAAAPKRGRGKKAAAADDADAPEPAPKKGRAAKKAKADDEDDTPAPPLPAPKKAPAKRGARGKAAAAAAAADDDDAEEEAPASKKRKAPAKKAPAKKGGKAAADEDDEEEEEAAPEPPAKKGKVEAEEEESTLTTVKMVKKGKAPVDIYSGLVGTGHVLEQGSDVFNCMLNQTNVGNNNNKFYVIQVIESDAGNQYWCFTRWGRVGVPGQNKKEPFGSNKAAAINSFHKKFNEKTRNQWDNRASFRAVPGKYTLIELDYGDDEETNGKEEAKDAKPREIPGSKLAPTLQTLMELLFDVKKMEETLIEFDIDIKKMPLGKLTKKQVKTGYEILTEIQDLLKRGGASRSALEDCTNRFYTNIPHNFRMSRPPVIDTNEKLQTKIQLVQALADIEIASHLVRKDSSISPVDNNYLSLKCELSPIDRGAPEWNMVSCYMTNTHATTHSQYSLDLLDLFSINREGEAERFKPFSKLHNRMLLWHGSRVTNFVGILSQGLRIAPPEAPVTGYMFGKGVYFADMVSKSANYCRTTKQSPVGVMMLAEVACGDMYETLHAEYMDHPPAGKHSTKGVGTTTPSPDDNLVLPDGMIVPLGRGAPTGASAAGSSLLYNEFIVYDVAQIMTRYLLRVRFNYKY